MDRNKFSSIAHRDHAFYNPISENKINKIISLTRLQNGSRVIDIGAGQCELLIRFIEKYKAYGIGVEIFAGCGSYAAKRASGRVSEDQFSFVNEDASAFLTNYSGPQFDLAICNGSTHALGGFENAIKSFQKIVKKDGYILIGEGYWKTRPCTEYLVALGNAEESELKSHMENIDVGENIGLTCLWSSVASPDDWDEYEWLYSMSIENYVNENPDDPDNEEMLKKIRSWRHAYLKWGRETLGYGLYLFRN